MFGRGLRRMWICCGVVAGTVAPMIGCVGPMPGSLSGIPYTPASHSYQQTTRHYQPVDFKKWASGMYPDEFFGKAVVVDGYFFRAPYAGQIGSDIHFSVMERSQAQIQRAARRAAMHGNYAATMTDFATIPVSAPLSMRDTIYPIKNNQHVRVYGVVVNPYSTSIFTRQVVASSLLVKADRVEVVR
jgi:hypothetical protein